MQPTRVIAVDWSGARTGEQKKIWLAEIAVSASSASSASQGQLVRLCDGWTREDVTDELVRIVHESNARGERAVIGLDFSFGFPAWYAERNGWRSGRDVWDAWTAERVEQTLVAPGFPFWGRGSHRAKPQALHDESETPPLRATERDNARTGPRPFSVFQLVGAGAVGVGSLRGMATLRALCAAGAVIWPFDGGQLTAEGAEGSERELLTAEGAGGRERQLLTAEGAEARRKDRGGDAPLVRGDENGGKRDVVVVEIWPRLYAPAVNKSCADDRVLFLRGLGVWDMLAADGQAHLHWRAQAEASVRRSDDAFDALMGALALWSAREELVRLPIVLHEAERLEGRIWRPAQPLK